MDEQESPFTVAENELFEQLYIEGYDLTIDPRYNKWLQAHHPDAAILAHIPQVPRGTLVPLQQGDERTEEAGKSSAGSKDPE